MEEKTDRPTVLCVGSMGKDIFFPLYDGRDTSPCATPRPRFCFSFGDKVHVHDRYMAPGGCACNVSVGLSRLDIGARALGVIGDDADGAWITHELRDDGVDTHSIMTKRDANTDLSVIIVDTSTGERTIFVNRDIGERLVLTDGHVAEASWCFVGSLYGDAIADNMALLHTAARSGGMRLAYNPGGHNIAQQADLVMQLIRVATCVFVNKEEALRILAVGAPENAALPEREEEIVGALAAQMTQPSACVVVTDGTRGAWTNDAKGGTLHVETSDKAALDTTGAGDAFASGFLAALLHGADRARCMQWGAANSDSVIEHYGAQKGLLTYAIMEHKADTFRIV